MPYKVLTQQAKRDLAESSDVSINQIMQWYASAQDTEEKVDMVVLMKERVKVCQETNKIW